MEAAVCNRLTLECRARGATLLQQVRFPLIGLPPKPGGRPHTVTVDFVVVDSRGPTCARAIDAKGRRVSRDWPLRAAAFLASYGHAIQETDR